MFGQQFQSPAVPVGGYGPTQAPAPYAPYYPAQTNGMGDMLEMIMPIMMLMLVMTMIMPMFKEMGKGS